MMFWAFLAVFAFGVFVGCGIGYFDATRRDIRRQRDTHRKLNNL